MASGVHVVLVTAPVGEGGETGKVGRSIADALVVEGLAACVSRVPAIHSTYIWEGKLCRDEEELLVIKAPSETLPLLLARVQELHPYEVPEVLALDVDRGYPPYVEWVLDAGRRRTIEGGTE